MKRNLLICLLSLIVVGTARTFHVQAADSTPTRVLVFGGHASHDFKRWFNEFDTALLNKTGEFQATYTDKPEEVPEKLKTADVLYLCANQPLPNTAVHEAIKEFANSGKGLVLVHAGLWYNWSNWTDYNRTFAAGGSRGHDRFGEFEVTVDNPSHPVMKGVPASFKITDELYWHQVDSLGSKTVLLATARNSKTDKSHPCVWITEHPKTRIVCITLGHDGQAHEHEAYQTLLKNSIRWVSQGNAAK